MKDIKGYEGLYAITSCGRVWSYRKNKFLTPILHSNVPNAQYYRVFLYKKGTPTPYQIHRLVAEAYIPNSENLPIVNHKDEDKFNNCVNNLEWCTYLYNNTYGTALKRNAEKHFKPVYCEELNKTYNSLTEAANDLHISKSHLCEAIKGTRKSVGGYHYHWRYLDWLQLKKYHRR